MKTTTDCQKPNKIYFFFWKSVVRKTVWSMLQYIAACCNENVLQHDARRRAATQRNSPQKGVNEP